MAIRPPTTFDQLAHTAVPTQLHSQLNGEIQVFQPQGLTLASIIDDTWWRVNTGQPTYPLQIYAHPDRLDTIRDTLHETLAADLIQEDRLTIRELPPDSPTELPGATDGHSVYFFASAYQRIIAHEVGGAYKSRLSEALNTPTVDSAPEWVPDAGSLTATLTDFAQTFGDEATAFHQLITHIVNPTTAYDIDGDKLLLIAGGIDTLQMYELTQWVERVGFSSRSTLNRKKNQLINEGVLAITREPQSTGRPRQILTIARSLPETHQYTTLLQGDLPQPAPAAD